MIPIEADDERIAELPRALEIAHMAEVQQVETTVGGDDALAAPAR
jgi:LPS O-antigen subunit length determinant protein (WzzB/FepE family)